MIIIINDERIDQSEYEDCVNARWQSGRFLDDAGRKKYTHSYLDYLNPSEF